MLIRHKKKSINKSNTHIIKMNTITKIIIEEEVKVIEPPKKKILIIESDSEEESDQEDEDKQDKCCGCENMFYWRELNYSSDDKGTLYCDDCMPESDNEESDDE